MTGFGPAISKAINENKMMEVCILLKQRLLLEDTCFVIQFEGTIKEACQESDVPDLLVALASMILGDYNTVPYEASKDKQGFQSDIASKHYAK